MNPLTYWITEHLALSNRQLGTTLGCTFFMVLAAGCATQSAPGLLEYNEPEPVVQCRGGTIMYCGLESGRLRWINKQISRCDCMDPDEFDAGEFR
jgi:hypothetical protein